MVSDIILVATFACINVSFNLLKWSNKDQYYSLKNNHLQLKLVYTNLCLLQNIPCAPSLDIHVYTDVIWTLLEIVFNHSFDNTYITAGSTIHHYKSTGKS